MIERIEDYRKLNSGKDPADASGSGAEKIPRSGEKLPEELREDLSEETGIPGEEPEEDGSAGAYTDEDDPLEAGTDEAGPADEDLYTHPDEEDPGEAYTDEEETGDEHFSWQDLLPDWLSLPVFASIIIAVGVLAAALFAILINRNWFYGRYEVVFSRQQEDAISFSYCNADGNILRYGVDGATLYDQEGNTIWDVAYSMDEPSVVTRDDLLAIYDASGTSIVICDRTGQIGAVTTKHPVLRADIARQGTVATIQEDRQNAWIEYYSKEGDTIAEIKTSIEDPGYPMDLAVSPDGMLLAVTYTGFSGGEQTGTVHFYNFGSYGQNQMDNRVAAFDYSGRVIPEVGNLGENGFVAFRDNGFSLYSGGGIPGQRAEVTLEGQIEAVFYDEAHIGLLAADPEDGSTHMKVYDINGREVSDRQIEVSYQKIELFGNEVNFYNGAGLSVYTLNGTEKFNGDYGEPAQAFFAIGKYRYVAVTENSVNLIRLK